MDKGEGRGGRNEEEEEVGMEWGGEESGGVCERTYTSLHTFSLPMLAILGNTSIGLKSLI